MKTPLHVLTPQAMTFLLATEAQELIRRAEQGDPAHARLRRMCAAAQTLLVQVFQSLSVSDAEHGRLPQYAWPEVLDIRDLRAKAAAICASLDPAMDPDDVITKADDILDDLSNGTFRLPAA